MTPADLITFDGTTQPISEWALDYGIPASLIIERLDAGMTIETAITTMMPFKQAPAATGSRAKRYTHNGHTLTIKQWAAHTGIPQSTIAGRLAGGRTIGEAIDAGVSDRAKTFLHDGEAKTLADWARHFGVSYYTLRHRVIRQGLSIGDAVHKVKFSKPAARRPAHQPRVTIRLGDVTITIKGPGVASILGARLGTGAGSAAQEMPETDFSNREASQ